MYYATKRNNNSTRLVGAGAVVVINALVFWALASGFGAQVIHELTNTEVVIIETPEEIEEEPPPPPPPDVDLPPPPPQVILPDFTFDAPVSENAIKQVEQVREPVKQNVAPPPPPKATIATRPKPGRRFEKPEYPAASIRAQEEGDVGVSACVDEQGKMTDVKIIKSSGFPRLDEATLKGLPRTRLDPAKGSDGKPIAMCNPPYQFTIEWNLEEAR
jgi:periplasmic protein TonB